MSLPLNLPDRLGRQRRGRAVILTRLTAGCDLPAEDEDFRIVILSEPPDGPVTPGAGVVVSAPAARLTCAGGRLRETAPAYSASRQSTLPLSARDMELLRSGRLFASAPLQHTAAEIFGQSKADLNLLARDLIAAEEMKERLGLIAVALAAPEPARPAGPERLEELRDLIQAMSGSDLQDTASEAQEALDRLSDLAFADGPEQLLTCLTRTYTDDRSLMEDIYLLRALRQSPDEAKRLLAGRRFLLRAALPDEEPDLAMDRSLVMEQLTPAALVTEPDRLAPVQAALERFRRRYAARYTHYHTEAWAETAREHARLLEARSRAEALRRINTLSELGPPVGVGALAASDELAAQAAGCPLIAGVEDIVLTDAVCPACGLSLDQPRATHRVDDVLLQVDRSLSKQMGRLSSSAVQQVLRRSNDPQVEHFLRVVQASQISSLCDVIDDELIGYLRRFLVESRIRAALEPVLDQLQNGETPDLEQARDAMREVAQHVQRAFEATQRALPPPHEEPQEALPESRKPRSRRKRKP
ncbi:MAG: hypothetical protein WD379_05985 [Dehalococcoidia bacterium]